MRVPSFLAVAAALASCAPGAEAPRGDAPATGVPVDGPADAVTDAARDQAHATDSAAVPVTSAPAALGAPDTLHGRVVVTGMGPATYATISSPEGPVVLGGDLETELRQLSGATVAAYGTRAGSGRQTFDVQHYEVLEIDGSRPVVGIVLPGGARLVVGTDTLVVRGHGEPLPEGAKIWITGHREGGEIRLLSWGAIRRS